MRRLYRHTHAHLGSPGGGRARPGERRGQRGRARCRSRHRRAIPPTPSLESRCRLHPRLNHTRLHHTYTHTCACRRRLPLVPRSARWRTLPAGAAVFGLNSTPPKRIPMYAYLQVPVACSRRSPSLRVVLPPPVPLLCLSFFFCLPWVCLSLLLSFWLAVCVQSVSVCLREVCPCMRGRVRVCVSACVRACVCVRGRHGDTHVHTPERKSFTKRSTFTPRMYAHTGAEGAIDVPSSARDDADERDDGDR